MDTMTTMCQLGLIYQPQGHYDKAGDLLIVFFDKSSERYQDAVRQLKASIRRMTLDFKSNVTKIAPLPIRQCTTVNKTNFDNIVG